MRASEAEKKVIYGKLVPSQQDPRPIALVGASANPEKYGNIILRNLQEKGLPLWPVNPREKRLAGLPVYPSLAELPGVPAIVNVVTPPAVSLGVLEEAHRLGYPAIWFQEGSYDDQVLARLDELPIPGVTDACIMVVAAQVGREE